MVLNQLKANFEPHPMGMEEKCVPSLPRISSESDARLLPGGAGRALSAVTRPSGPSPLRLQPRWARGDPRQGREPCAPLTPHPDPGPGGQPTALLPSCSRPLGPLGPGPSGTLSPLFPGSLPPAPGVQGFMKRI